MADAAPYLIGEKGYGHFWLGNRIGTTFAEYPIPDTIFVERVSNLRYGWGKDGSRGWTITVGYKEPEDPALKALDLIRMPQPSGRDAGNPVSRPFSAFGFR